MWDKAFPRSFENLRNFDLGSKAHHMGDFKGAVRIFKKVVRKEPDVSFGWYILLECLSYLGKWEEMIEVGEKALKLHPNFGPSYSWIGDAYNQLGKKKQAMDCYKKGCGYSEKELILIDKKLVNSPQGVLLHAALLNSLGEINFRLGNYEEAIKYNKRAFKIRPDEHNLHGLGLAYKKMGNYDTAIEYLKKSLDINPKHSYAWFDLGLIYEDSNDSKKAIECFEKAVESSPQWVKLRKKLVEVKPDSLALLKEVPNIGIHFDETIAQRQTKSEVIIKEIKEIENILKDSGVTAEEKKYFAQRKLKLTKELQLIKTLKQDDAKEKLIEEARKKKLMEQKQKHLENIEEEIERYKLYRQALKSDLSQLIIKLKKGIPGGIQKEKLNENKNILESEIKMVDLIIETYEIRSKVKNLDSEHKELVAKDREGEFVSDLLKSNRIEVELLNKQDKENSDIIKELLKELGEQKRKYRDQYEMVDKDKLDEMRENIELSTKAGDRAKNMKKTLEEIVKNDEEYKILLRRKKKGESVEDLIKRNRKYAKILAQKNKEKSEEFRKWMKSEEGKKSFKLLEEERRMNPEKARADDIRYEYGLKIINEIKKNEEEYEKLLKRENKGEYVDDLIKQNLYKAKILAEQNRKYADEENRRINTDLDTQNSHIFYEMKKNEEEYEKILEKKNKGEFVDDLIKQNLHTGKILTTRIAEQKSRINIVEDKEIQGVKDLQRERQETKDDETQKELQTLAYLENLVKKSGKNLLDFMKTHMEYKDLLKREELGEVVEDLIKQNRIYAEVIRTKGMKVQFEAKKWLKMNPDWFQDPMSKQGFLMVFFLSRDISKKQLREEKKKRQSQKCPNCRIMMDYLEYLDAYQCPKCKKKYYIFEKKLTIIGHPSKDIELNFNQGELKYKDLVIQFLRENQNAYTTRALQKRLIGIINDHDEKEYIRQNLTKILHKMTLNGIILSTSHDGEEHYFNP